MDQILRSLPKLKTLKVRFNSFGSQQTLSCQTPSNVETLCIEYGHPEIHSTLRLNLNLRKLPKLRQLSLWRCNISQCNLRCLEDESSITSLTLRKCRLKRLSDLLLLTSLQHVELKSNRIKDLTEEPDEDNISSVRSLKVTRVTRDKCLAFVNLFKGLEQFDAGDDVAIDDAILEELSNSSPQLKELRFSGCTFAMNCPSEALHLFAALKTFFIMCAVDVFDELKGTLEGLRPDVEVRLQGM